MVRITAVTAVLVAVIAGVLPIDQIAALANAGTLIAFTAATTLIIGAGYTLWLYKRVFFGEVGNAHVAELKDINGRETLVLGIFAAAVLVLGFYPKPLTDLMEPSIAQLASQLAASKLL